MQKVKKSFLIGVSGLALVVLTVAGCATPKRADLQKSADLKASFDEVISYSETLRQRQVDLLGHESFEDGLDALEDARESYNENDTKEEVIEDLEEAMAYFKLADQRAKAHTSIPVEIMQARKMAVRDLALGETELRDHLEDIDEDLISESDFFRKTLNAQKVSELQKRYLDLEVMTIQDKNLHRLRAIVERAVENGAQEKAPDTLRKAEIALSSAENAIEQSPRDVHEFKEEVFKAKRSAKLLSDVMEKLLGKAQGSSEEVALKLVYQERSLHQTQRSLNNVSERLIERSGQALSAKAKLSFQKAMDQVRKEFTSQEAEVYQQGEKLILRLKKLNFGVGSAKIPSSSTKLLTKVEAIIKDIYPEKVSIEGHTDSTGKTSVNQRLSLNRAKAVESFLTARNPELETEATGLGESKPIATNETTEGRALNRRVDIIVDAK